MSYFSHLCSNIRQGVLCFCKNIQFIIRLTFFSSFCLQPIVTSPLRTELIEHTELTIAPLQNIRGAHRYKNIIDKKRTLYNQLETTKKTMSDTEEDSTCSDSWPITEDWLIEVLKKHHEVRSGIKITDFKVKQGCQDGVNNLSDILSVSVVYEFEKDIEPGVSQSLDIVIKLLPQDPFSRYFVTEAQFDLREIKFYTSVCTA